MMFGSRNTVNVTNSHYWVCDGVRSLTRRIFYFAEFLIGGNFRYDGTGSTSCNPRETMDSFLMFHMNWGWRSGNGWFFGSNSANSPNGNFQHHRRNYFVHPR